MTTLTVDAYIGLPEDDQQAYIEEKAVALGLDRETVETLIAGPDFSDCQSHVISYNFDVIYEELEEMDSDLSDLQEARDDLSRQFDDVIEDFKDIAPGVFA